MILKSFKFLILSALLCSAILAITITITSQSKSQTTTKTCLDHRVENAHPGLILVGDPVPGGGTPTGGNQTRNQTE